MDTSSPGHWMRNLFRRLPSQRQRLRNDIRSDVPIVLPGAVAPFAQVMYSYLRILQILHDGRRRDNVIFRLKKTSRLRPSDLPPRARLPATRSAFAAKKMRPGPSSVYRGWDPASP